VQTRLLDQIVGTERCRDRCQKVTGKRTSGRTGGQKQLLPNVDGITQPSNEHERLRIENPTYPIVGDRDAPEDCERDENVDDIGEAMERIPVIPAVESECDRG
jgi:hypothetical protein